MINSKGKSQNKPSSNGAENRSAFLTLVNNLTADLSARSQEIIRKRFGIGQKEPETLEKIGQEYQVTRERVRQIIVDNLKKIAKKKNDENFKKAEEEILFTIEGNHGIIEERKLLSDLGGNNFAEANAILFFGGLSDKIKIIEEKGTIKRSWAISKDIIDKIKEVESLALDAFAKEKKLLHPEEIVKVLTGKVAGISDNQARNFLSVLEKIAANNFGKLGLIVWPEISPKGTRERIYIVLKEKNKPLHFSEIAKFIDEYNLSKRKSHPQTVHNELIKDERFVLIGRGIYALKEWGYESGTVKDILERILKENKEPLAKEEILSRILKSRKVKKSTVMINLNNHNFFIKQGNTYSIKK